MPQYYTYQLINSIDNQPFYIGKGSGSRMYQHIKEATREGYTKRSVHCKIVNILNNGGEVLYSKVNTITEQEAFHEEKRLIALYGRKDLGLGLLCNLTDGGEGTSNQNLESIEKRAAKHRGMKRSGVAKENMKQAQLKSADERRTIFNGKACSHETSEKMSKSRKGKEWSSIARDVVRNKPTANPVLAYRKSNGEFIGEYESGAACARALNVDGSSVWKICEGWMSKAPDGSMRPYKSHRGYTFKYKIPKKEKDSI